MRHVLCLAALLLTAADAPTPIPVSVPTRKEPVSYANEVADVLDAKCVGCHSSALAESKLNLEEVAGMLKGGKHGPAIVPGKADESLLLKMAAHRVEPVMPPKDKKGNPPLTPEELGLIKLWIDAGAKDDSSENAEPARAIELGTLPPGVHPIVAVDMTADGERIAAGRANVVHVYDATSGLIITSLGGHKDIIQSIRFSADGTRLAAGSYQFVTIWNVPTGRLEKTLTGHTDQVRALAVSADGKTAYSSGPDRTVRVWSVAEGKQLRQFSAPAPVTSLALSPDGRLLALGGSDNVVAVVIAEDGKALATLKAHSGAVTGVAFVDRGARLVSVSADGTARVWSLPPADLAAAATVAEPRVLTGHKGPVQAVAATQDGRTIATGGDDGTVRLWNAADGAPVRAIEGGSNPVLALAFSPHGDALLAGTAGGSARLNDVQSGTVRQTLSGHTGAVRSVGFSPGGDRVVTAGSEGGLKVWDAKTGQGVIAFGHAAPSNGSIQPVLAAAFTNDYLLISTSTDKTLKTWSVSGAWSEMKPLGPHVFRVLSIDFSPDGKLIATGGGEPSRSGEVKLWDVATGALVRTLGTLHSDTVFGVRFSPDGSKLATAAADKFLKVTNVADGKELKSFEGHTHHVLAVDWSSDGKQLVTGGADNVLKVWDYESGEQLRTLPPAGKQVTAVRWLSGKTLVAGASGDNVVRFWETKGGITRTFSGPSDFVFGVAVSQDGNRVAAGGADGVLYLWNGQNGQVLRKLEPPPAPAATAAAAAR